MTGVLAYYQFVVLKEIGRDLNAFREHLFLLSDQVGKKIAADYPDPAKMSTYIEDVASQEKLKIALYDIKGNRVCSVDRRKERGLNLELKTFTVVGDKNIYIIEFDYPFSISNFGQIRSVKNLRNFSLLLLLFFMIALIIYLHYSLGEPLTALHRGLEKVNYRNTRITVPLSAKRKDEIGDLGRKFAEMLERLDSSRRQQTEMIASISHDLKTPLTSILGYLERLQTGKNISDAKKEEYLRIISRKAQDIKELLDEFADYAFNDLGTDALVLEKVSLYEFFSQLALEYRGELEAFGVALKVDNKAPRDAVVEADPAKIRRVFANLIQNALKHGGKVTEIALNCRVSNSMAVFAVEDNGCGVPAEELGAIFDKFYRLDKSRSAAKGGCGLGLTICKNIIETHGGCIHASLREGGGLSVVFSLPLKATAS